MTAPNLIELFRQTEHLVAASADYEMQNQLAQLRETYSAMLRFMVQGLDDPNASQIYANLVCQTYELGDRANRMQRLRQVGTDKYVQTYASMRKDVQPMQLLAALEAHDEALHKLKKDAEEMRDSILQHERQQHQNGREELLLLLFNRVWTSDVWHKNSQEAALALLGSTSIFTADKALLVSAVTLALTEMFDERKLMFLFDAYLHNERDISQRAIVGIVLTLRQHSERIAVYPEVQARFSLLCDDPKFVRDSFRVMMQLQFSKLTDSVSEKMRSDIIPTILQSKKFKQTQYGIQEIDDYMTQNGENPEWLKNSKADDRAQQKIHEMAELQMEGADVYMATFSHMKNNAFFQAVAHWFYVFSSDIPAVDTVLSKLGDETSGIFRAMLRYAPFCNSDRFSFAFMLGMIGSQGQEMLSKNLTGNLSEEELSEMLSTKQEKQRDADISRQYIFDLYRFFTLYPFHQQFYNPFDTKQPAFTPLAHPIFEPLMQHYDEVLALAEFFMRKAVYKEAVELFRKLLPEKREEDADIWQKIGFCEQKQNHLQEAFDHYKVAFELTPNSTWTLKHLAAVAFQGEWWTEAEAYYELLLDNDPDNVRYLKRKAGCLMHQQRYDEAIPVLYKVIYLEEESVDNQNNLAWCQLLTGNIDKARDLYTHVLSQHLESASAHFNLAHTYLAAGDVQQAYPLYRQAYLLQSATDEGEKQFVSEYCSATEALRTVYELTTERVQALLDAIRMGI